jgi:uncharacterized membrane protein YkvA (DUF1232 family)
MATGRSYAYIVSMQDFPTWLRLPDQDDERLVRSRFWGKLRRVASRTSFAREALAAYLCAVDPATPMRVKAVLLSALAYFIIPTDAIPDFIAGLGFTDDAAVLFTVWRTVGPEIKETHRERARAVLEGGLPQDDAGP